MRGLSPEEFRSVLQQRKRPSPPKIRLHRWAKEGGPEVFHQAALLEINRVLVSLAFLCARDPALRDRLAAIGFQNDEITESAASRYLHELPEDFEPSMNRLWRERIVPAWKNRYTEIQNVTKRIAELDEQAKIRIDDRFSPTGGYSLRQRLLCLT